MIISSTFLLTGDEDKPRVWKATFRNALNASKYIKFGDKRETNARICMFIKPDCKEKLRKFSFNIVMTSMDTILWITEIPEIPTAFC